MLNLSRRQYMETGILLALAIIIYGWYIQKWTLVLIGAGCLAISLIVPILFKPLAFIWFGLAKVLSLITSNILLTVLFFLLITPIGLFRKMLGKDSLNLKKFKNSSKSVLIKRGHLLQPSDLENPF